MNRSWLILGFCAVLLVAGFAVIALLMSRAPEYPPTKVRPTLEQETRRLEAELPLAASKLPYLVLDLLSGRLEYRISGMSPKSIPFQIGSLRGAAGTASLDPRHLTLLVLKERGAPREVIKPPDPDKPVDPLKDPKIFPPDPPSEYVLSFEEPVRIRVVGERRITWKSGFTALRRAMRRWVARRAGKESIRIEIRLPAERAQEIYRSLYPGERILVLGIGSLKEGKTEGEKRGAKPSGG
ncbi:MAG TPA: hypothetical protein VGR67_01190 [Candidatus Polarisedimenticolia bacterium]|jgi:hypothetical protein|nr:hypothetical protein [Candidatus Polarisedimenticolia bacterium]